MKFEEYDKKAALRAQIRDLEEILKRFDGLKDGSDLLGVGVIWHSTFCDEIFKDYVNDKIVVEGFKKIIEERRDELIKEFES